MLHTQSQITMYIRTNINLIFNALTILNQEEMSLENALDIASSEMNLQILDDFQIIRDFLLEKNLIKSNSKLTFPNYRETLANNLTLVYNKIHEDFINDHLTNECISLIENKLLLDKLLEE